MLPEEQEKILSNLKVQLKNQVRFTSLKILCVRKVAESLPLYAKQRLMVKLFSVLPKTLCSLLYQEILDSYKDNLNLPLMADWHDFDLDEKLYLFAGKELEEFDCRILNMERILTDDHPKPFEQLAKESPKLRCFKDNRQYRNMYRKSTNHLLSDYYSLQTMSSLVVLEIEFYPAQDTDLQVIGTCLSLLQRLYLVAPVDEFNDSSRNISLKGLEYLTNLKSLKHLTFEVDDPEDEKCVELVKNCLQLMPQVDTVGRTGNFLCVIHELPSYQGPVKLGLQHLVLGENTVIPSNVSLPNVTTITVAESSFAVSLKQFKELRHFSYAQNDSDNNDWSQFEQTLSQVGHLLKSLQLFAYYACDLMHVLTLCPNLYELNLDEVLFVENFNASQLKNCVQYLQRFRHSLLLLGSDDRSFDSCGLLHLLLSSCPELEELQLSAIKLTKAELDLINNDLDCGGLTIQKLQKVEITAVVDEETVASFAEFATKLCVKNCNILKRVYIDEYFFKDNKRMPELEPALVLQHSINCKHMFTNDSIDDHV